MLGILAGTFIASYEMKRRGGDPDILWDGLIWAVPAGIVGSRLWYCTTDILNGNTRYIDEPVRILNITEGGLHFYGGILFAGLAFLIYSRIKKLDMRLIADTAAPAILIGQAIARPANFINQELYGPPTDLPWGIAIDSHSRIPPWTDLARFPIETTRFHPTFAYEIILNLLGAAILLWLGHRYVKKIKPGTIFTGWLIAEGIGRVIVESFRPDQPRLAGTDLSYSRLVAAIMAVVGILILLAKYEVIRIPFIKPEPTSYKISAPKKSEIPTEDSK